MNQPVSDDKLVEMAFAMHQYSYVPYSHFPVGAALLCEDGTVYTGCNVENAALGSSICAERTALVKAVSEGRTGGFVAIAIAGKSADYCSPCGACRQMLYEFGPDMRVLLARGDGSYITTTLRELLPYGFGPDHLSV